MRLQVVVRELGALGLPGRARRVEDHRGVAAVDLGELAHRLGLGEQALELAAAHGHDLDAPASSAPFRGLLREPVPREQQLRAGVREVVGDLAALEEDVHRHDHRAGAHDAE